MSRPSDPAAAPPAPPEAVRTEPARSSAGRRLPFALLLVVVTLVSFFVFNAFGVGGHTAAKHASSPAALAPLATYSPGSPHVLSSLTVYPRGSDFTQPTVPERPKPAARFDQPTAEYLRYATAQLTAMEGPIAALQRALRADDRSAAQAAWRSAYATYLHLGAVYLVGEVALLNKQINGNSSGLEGGVQNPRFTGLHRIEYGLWSGTQPRALLTYASGLLASVRSLRHALPQVKITPLEYATRAHEILEDAQRDLLSGADVPQSGEGVLGTAAGLVATEEVMATLRPLFGRDQQALPVAETELAALRKLLAAIARAHGGRLPSNAELSQSEAERLDGTLGGALEGLSQVPGSLETEVPR